MLPDSVHFGRQSRPLKGFSHFHNRGRNKRIFKTSGSELQICPIVQGNISALMAQKRRLRIKCMRNLLCRKSLILCGFSTEGDDEKWTKQKRNLLCGHTLPHWKRWNACIVWITAEANHRKGSFILCRICLHRGLSRILSGSHRQYNPRVA